MKKSPLHDGNLQWRFNNDNNEQNLQNKYQGHTIHKIPVSCLVMKYPHTDDGTDTSADDGNDKECGLWYAPKLFDCLSLINAHHGKAGQIHHDKIHRNNTEYCHGF